MKKELDIQKLNIGIFESVLNPHFLQDITIQTPKKSIPARRERIQENQKKHITRDGRK